MGSLTTKSIRTKSEGIIVGEPVVTSIKTRVPQILYFTLVDYSYFSMIELVKR